MARLLELREVIRIFCAKYEPYVKIVLRFVLAAAAYFLININLGYMEKLNSVPLIIVLAVISALLPVNVTVFISAVLVLAHLYALHFAVCIVAAVLFLVILLLYFRFAPKYGYCVMLTPMLFRFGISPVMPVAAGLLGSPSAIIAVAAGTVVSYFLNGIKLSAGLLSAEGSELDVLNQALSQLFENREMMITLIVYVATSVIVYFIRRSSIDHAWLLAIAAGTIFNLISLLMAYVILKVGSGIFMLVVGEAVSLCVSFVLRFMVFSLDYSRVEKVQFEDDDYYYYVKAVPKLYVSAAQKEVKQFHRAEGEAEKKEEG